VAGENPSDAEIISENSAPEISQLLANARKSRAFFEKPETPTRDGSGWLGRLDSNQGMAESKSDNFLHMINAHSEKFAKYASSSINRSRANSECRHEHSTCERAVMSETPPPDDPTKSDSLPSVR
jgi:hypothetical protein